MTDVVLKQRLIEAEQTICILRFYLVASVIVNSVLGLFVILSFF